ncbi:MAG TPA: esterase-like activity of phytase family protein [Sphingobium sp.]|uniref:esterase-like activity of phytase family protein n=1 Tax=Sphingobium sp. TaxID=1912891 RepID=UPI002ED442CC
MDIRFGAVWVLALGVGGMAGEGALAQSRQVTAPNIAPPGAPTPVSLDGDVFVNHGLVGVGRLDADTRDFAGETLGSFSGMTIDPASWHRNADGSYGGTLYTIPDRGPNDVGTITGTTDYRNRVEVSEIRFRPYGGKAALPQSPASQSQLDIIPTGGFLLTDATGMPFTGKEPGSNVITRDGIAYPGPVSGEGAGRISLDSEAIARLPDGSFYISDEYAAHIYYFDAKGRQIGTIAAVPALLPRTGAVADFNSEKPGETGRRNNQGLEALAITPDHRHLLAILQSATIQDSSGQDGKGGEPQMRNNTRVLVYDIAQSRTPAKPVGHYVLQLPVYNSDGAGAPNRTAAQSEMVALSASRFLVLARDGIGRGATPTKSATPVFKSILVADMKGATNLAGSPYEQGVEPVAQGGALVAGITPVRQAELVNLLDPAQLGRFGMNLDTRPSNATSLSEKWEAMAIVPTLDEKAPRDVFLFVGNDNDFEAAHGLVNGQPFDASVKGEGGTGNNDNVILVYRLTLPEIR